MCHGVGVELSPVHLLGEPRVETGYVEVLGLAKYRLRLAQTGQDMNINAGKTDAGVGIEVHVRR